jgi:uncharacterized protein (DUF885 family)
VPPEDRVLAERAQEYFDDFYRFYPVAATTAGLHTYDDELGKFAEDEVQSRLTALRDFRQRLLGVDPRKLSRAAFVDFLLLTSAVKAEIHEWEEIETWRKSPRFYSALIRAGIWSLMQGGYPDTARLQAFQSRLRQIPGLLETGKDNLEAPPRLYVEAGIAELKNCLQIIGELPVALEEITREELSASLHEASLEAAHALAEFISYLETGVRLGATDAFRMGPERLSEQILYREMEDTPLKTIRLVGERHLRDTRERMKALARELDASRPTAQHLADIAAQKVPPEELLASSQEAVDELGQFMTGQTIVSSLPGVPLAIVETPPLLRRRAQIVLDASGPLEAAGDAVFMVTLPSPTPIPGQAEASFPALSSQALRFVAMRESYPGRYLRLPLREKTMSQTRRLLVSRANEEGWLLYSEQMLLDEGYGGDDPTLRLLQLQRAAVELSRLVTAILLHAEELSFSTAVQIFMNEAYLDPASAEREARAVASDPTLLSAALGKLQILKLRRDYLETEGSVRTLRDFHDAFLACGQPPLRLVRLLLLPEQEGPTLDD